MRARYLSLVALITATVASPDVTSVAAAAPAGSRSRSAKKKPNRGAAKREYREGVPVLRTRRTRGRTRTAAPTSEESTRRADGAPARGAETTVAPPAEKIVLTGKVPAAGNASMFIEGWLSAHTGLFAASVLSIRYPVQAAEGRFLAVHCDLRGHKGEINVQTRSYDRVDPLSTYRIWDTIVLVAKYEGRDQLDLLIDTTQGPTVASDAFEITITSEEFPIGYDRCLLTLMKK